VPPSMINWLAHQPSDLMNAKDCTFENMQFAYTVHHPEITHNDMLDQLIKKDLTRTIGSVNAEIVEELELTFHELFGSDTEQWKEVCVWDCMIKTVARTANRVFVGPELCRNDEYLTSCVNWTRDIQISGAILHMIPKFLKSALAWFVTIPNRRDTKINMKHTVPLVQQRIYDMNRKLQDPSYKYEEPNDFLTWMVRESFKRTTPQERSAPALAYRLLLLNFAAVSTSTIAATNALLDIISAPSSQNIIAALRDEALNVLHENNLVWTKASVAKLHRLDSAIRESSRVSGVGGTGLARRVRAANGIVLENGVWVPKGATVGVAQEGIHFDENFYERAWEFDAFRFSRSKEELTSEGSRAKDETAGETDNTVTKKPRRNEDLVTTSPHFLAFSHGLHACPGRFFAANQLKLLIVHFVLNYDVQPLATRPPNTALGDVMIPPLKATMRVRRKARKV